MYKLENNVQWTTDLKDAFKHNVTKSSIFYMENNVQKEINESNHLMNLTLTDNRYVPDAGFIGQATAKQVEINYIQTENSNINLENKELVVKIGAVYNNSTYYINYGNFIVNDPPENDETNGQVKIIAYDYMIKFNKPYEDQVIYPCTLKELLENICLQADVELGTSSFVNEDFIVENNQFEGYTLREVLQNISKCAFSWARIGQDNKLYLDFSTNTDEIETLTIEDYKQDCFKKANEYYGPINQVTYADSDVEGQEEKVSDDESIEEYGLHELVIYDNLFAYTLEKRQELIEGGSILFGLTYMPVSQLDSIGLIYLDCNDELIIEAPDENEYTTRNFNHTINYSGVITDEITTDGNTLTEQAYKNTSTTLFQNQQTRFSVDKANKKIQSLITQVGDRSQKTTSITQDVDTIQSKVEEVADLTRDVEGIKTITINDAYPNEEALELHIYGNNTVFNHLYPSNDLYPSNNLYPHGDSELRFYNSEEDITVDLGITEVLRANAEVKDEVSIIDSIITVIRRVNPDGTTKSEEEVTTLDEVHFILREGENTFEIVNYSAPIKAKYVMPNTYTGIFLPRVDVGTSITQNTQAVQIAWNQISQKIQADVVNNKASISIYDENDNRLMNLNESGQHFWENGDQFANMGVEKEIIEVQEEGEDEPHQVEQKYIAFSVNGDYGSYINNGMAWGIRTPDSKFYPILYIKDFHIADEQSGDFGGNLSLANCDLVLEGLDSGISTGRIKMVGDIAEKRLSFIDTESQDTYLVITPENETFGTYKSLKILDNISFYKNQSDSSTFKIGDDENYCFFTDDGGISCSGDLLCSEDIVCKELHVGQDGIFTEGNIYCEKIEGSNLIIHGPIQSTGEEGIKGNLLHIYGDGYFTGHVYANNISSDKRLKDNIKKTEISGIDTINKIDLKSFDWKDKKQPHTNCGMIAQEMEEIDKNFVLKRPIYKEGTKDIEDYQYYINELPIISTMIKAIQEQQVQINTQQSQIEVLQNKIKEMEEKLNG